MPDLKKILIIEDDTDIAELVEINVRDIGFELDKATEGQQGLEMALDQGYELIILDLMLPGLNGMEVCEKIREEDVHTPILMLTAKSEELDKVLGLEKGADDYLTKPFSIRELLARIKANIRRVNVDAEHRDEQAEQEIMDFGELHIEPTKRKVTLNDNKLELTPKEFDLLILFASHPGTTFSREKLLEEVWGYQFDGYDHTVNSHINRLRKKIETDPSDPAFLKTVWGVGYRFTEHQELEQ
jgi:DNA-binding response OmpR family regulator